MKETETQRGWISCPKLHSEQMIQSNSKLFSNSDAGFLKAKRVVRAPLDHNSPLPLSRWQKIVNERGKYV